MRIAIKVSVSAIDTTHSLLSCMAGAELYISIREVRGVGIGL